jgi:hypothetical protein
VKKLKLDLADLRVETFPAAAGDDAPRGTVAGYEDTRDGVDLIIEAVDRRDPRPVWFCNWGTDNGSAKPTTTNTIASGCGAGFAGRAGRPSPSCRTGWRLRDISACLADNRPANGSSPAILLSKQCRTARIHHAHQMHPPCAAGHSGDC